VRRVAPPRARGACAARGLAGNARSAGGTDALLELRQEGRGSSRSGKAAAAGWQSLIAPSRECGEAVRGTDGKVRGGPQGTKITRAMTDKHDEAQARQELEVFNLFVRRAQLRVRPETIMQTEPDILCTLENGETLRMELVQLDSQKSLRRVSHFLTSGAAWHEASKALPRERLDLFLKRYRDTAITLSFDEEPGKRDRVKRLCKIVETLLDKSPGFTGSVDLDGDSVVVEKQRGGASRGPISLGHLAGKSEPVEWTRIRDKLQGKRYRVDGRFELLAYSRNWLNDAVPYDDIRQWLRGSAFGRVWIFECVSNQVFRVDRPVKDSTPRDTDND
jgi:hypothetical protein